MSPSGRITVFFQLSCLLFLSGCSSLSYSIQPPQSPYQSGIHYIEDVPSIAQKKFQCGPAALESVSRHWGKEVQAEKMAQSLYKSGTLGVLNFMLALRVTPSMLGISGFHFAVLRGFDDDQRIFYANVGEAETHAIPYEKFQKRWKSGKNWCLIVCPPEKVDWKLESDQASDLALLLERSGRLDLAEKWYQYSLDRDPGNGITLFNLANVYLKTKRWDEAQTIYFQLLKEKPDWTPLSNNLAWIYLEKGKYQEAIDIIKTAFKKGAKRQHDILDTMALVHCKLRRFKQAEAYFKEALDQAPSDDPQAVQLIKSHWEQCKSSDHPKTSLDSDL
jgi:tetratricopeptide (TPR) repeat protein